MKLALLILLALHLSLTAADNEAPIIVEIGEGKALTVRIWVDRSDLVSIITTFFAKGDDDAKVRFTTLLKDSKDVTLELTTKRPK